VCEIQRNSNTANEKHTDTQTGRQTDNARNTNAYRLTDRQRDYLTCRQAGRRTQTDRKSDRHTDLQTGKQTDTASQTEIQTDKKAGRQAYRHTDRQTDRQNNIQTGRNTDRDKRAHT